RAPPRIFLTLLLVLFSFGHVLCKGLFLRQHVFFIGFELPLKGLEDIGAVQRWCLISYADGMMANRRISSTSLLMLVEFPFVIPSIPLGWISCLFAFCHCITYCSLDGFFPGKRISEAAPAGIDLGQV
ncbi:hypothetical protein J3F83DRAFT_744568, partial [Trichoderma novae-zelandiae]